VGADSVLREMSGARRSSVFKELKRIILGQSGTDRSDYAFLCVRPA
jgi:hypothetical protein